MTEEEMTLEEYNQMREDLKNKRKPGNKKICKACNVAKSLDEFYRDKNKKDGRFFRCKECTSKIAKKYYQENKERVQKKVKEYLELPGVKEKRNEKLKEYYKNHKEEHRQYGIEYRKNNQNTINKRMAEYNRLPKSKAMSRERSRRFNLKKKYGISVKDYEEIFISQNGECAICGKILERDLCVDHDHKTGKIRGLLCRYCNSGIGMFKENTTAMNKAIEYIKDHNVEIL